MYVTFSSLEAVEHEIAPLHWTAIPFMLHAWGRERARVWLKGSRSGTLADITIQAQSIPVLISDLNDSQHEVDGVVPLLVLPVMMLAHDVKLLIIEVVHGVLICPLARFIEITIRAANSTATIC